MWIKSENDILRKNESKQMKKKENWNTRIYCFVYLMKIQTIYEISRWVSALGGICMNLLEGKHVVREENFGSF